MYKTLSQFYTSTKWRDFRAYLIAERRNKEDGILYSEYSGKPLLNSYDIVLHHKIPLTLENVNDASISLNPENIMIVSQKEHNEIHARFGYCTERKVYYVYGAPCSGKTSFVNGIKGNSDLVVDIDSIWEALTGVRYHKPNALKQNVFAIKKQLLDMVKTRYPRQGWERAFVIDGGKYKVERERLIKELGAEPIYIDTTKEECLRRLHDNPNGRDVEQWKGYIIDYFTNFQQ